MENFADKFVEKMFISGEIGEEEKDRCRYIIVVKIEQILTLFVLLFGACFFRKVIPTVLFLIFFWQIRKRSGGYHMKNFERCFAGTVCIYIIWVKFLAPLLMIHSEIGYGLFAVSVLILEGIGSVNHPNMDWTKEEYAAGKQMTREIVLFEAAVIGATALLGADRECVMYMMFGVILSAALLLLAKVTGQDAR